MFKEFRTRKGDAGNKVVSIEPHFDAMPKRAAKPEIDTGLQAHLELKSRLHEGLLDRLNLSVIDKVEQSELRRQISALVTQLLDEEGVPMRSDAFARLVDELIVEVMGLGPLEPLLEDPTINDILVNSHDKVYVERFGVLEKSSSPVPRRTPPAADHRQDRVAHRSPDRRIPALGRCPAGGRQPGQCHHPALLGRRAGAVDPQILAQAADAWTG